MYGVCEFYVRWLCVRVCACARVCSCALYLLGKDELFSGEAVTLLYVTPTEPTRLSLNNVVVETDVAASVDVTSNVV